MNIFDKLPQKHVSIHPDLLGLLPESKRMTFVEYLSEDVVVPQHVTGYSIKLHKKKFLGFNNYTEVVNKLNNLFRRGLKIKFVVGAITPNLSKYEDEQINAKCNNDGTYEFKANSSFYDWLRNEEGFEYAVNHIDSTIGHEVVHRAIRLKSKPHYDNYIDNDVNFKGYLAQTEEMMSYAFNVIKELKTTGLSKEQALKLIQYNKSRLVQLLSSDSYKQYVEAFQPNSKTWKQFQKYLFQYIVKYDKL